MKLRVLGREERKAAMGGGFEELIVPHLDAAYNLARWLVRDPTLAQDVVQDAAVKALGYFGSYRGGDGRAWLLRIVRNAAYDALGARTRHKAESLDGDGGTEDPVAVQVADPAADPEASLAHAQDQRVLDDALAALPLDLRECLVLRELKEFSYKQIAQVTGLPIGTVMSRLWRARQVLMQQAAERNRMKTDPCAEMQLLVQADMDGELSPAEAARVAAHLQACEQCAELPARLSRLSARIRRETSYHVAPDALRARIAAMAAPPPAPAPAPARPGFRRPWPSLPASWRPRIAAPFGAGLAFAAVLLVLLLPRGGQLADEIAAGHIRALQPGHLMDVVSTDQHTVKPWFDGRLDFAPPVRDLKDAGFPLEGARLDYLAGRPVAVLVYKRRQHIIDVFVWPESGHADPDRTNRSGYNMIRWTSGGMAFWAVSDLDPKELAELVALLREN